jgi:hypothetical protein
MVIKADLLGFLNEIENDVTAEIQPAGGSAAEFRESAYTKIIADDLEASGVLESPTVCHCEHGRSSAMFKVSGYGVPDEDSRLDLFITVYQPPPHSEVPTLNASEADTAFRKLERYLGKALHDLGNELEPALPQRDMAERIHDLGGAIDRVHFHLFTNCRLAVRREKERKPEVHGLSATYEVWDLERIRRLRESGAGYETVSIDLRKQESGGLPCVRLGATKDGYQTSIAIFPGSLLRDLYDEHGSRLLELNVRSYLQAKGKINKGILETLRKNPADFMAYNNGITVVAERIVFGRLKNDQDGILELDGMQIVNGGQTTASIHRAAKEFSADLSQVYVQGKIVTVDPARFNDVVPLISRFANSQNKVTEPDLQANNRFHVGFERVASREWTPGQTSMWFYERARGSYQTARGRAGSTEPKRKEFDRKYPSSQRFSKEDLAKFENCWRGLPYLVNRGAQKNFAQFMTSIKSELGELPEQWEPSPADFRRFIAKAILFRDVQRFVGADKTITTYRINVTNYTVALLAEKTARRIDLDSIWKQQRISEPFAYTASLWARAVFKELLKYLGTQASHVDTILKSEETWKHMLSLDLKIPPKAEKELISTVGLKGIFPTRRDGDTYDSQDENNAARCMELDAAQWMAIVSWGSGVGELLPWQKGIATTLASYAAQGWPKAPSPKQAKHGAAMILAARTAGVVIR